MNFKHILKAAFLVLVVNTVSAQCSSFAKTKCLPRLKPYINSQQLANTVLLNGDKTQMSSTFYYGDEYRIMVCSDEKLGKIKLNIKDSEDNIVFTTQGYGNITWDFNVETTQDLTLEVITPPNTTGEALDKSGCVSILLGFK